MSSRARRHTLTLIAAFALLFFSANRVGPRAIASALGLTRARAVRGARGGSGGGARGGGGARNGGADGGADGSGGGGGSGGGARGTRRARACCGAPGAASLVWVMLGDSHFQPYLMESIRQARLFNRDEFFFVVVDPRHFAWNHSWVEQMDALRVRGARARTSRLVVAA
jgi:hypothetical protein